MSCVSRSILCELIRSGDTEFQMYQKEPEIELENLHHEDKNIDVPQTFLEGIQKEYITLKKGGGAPIEELKSIYVYCF